ncbi:MAG: dihydroxy-acid dehydratase, partial [Betaproteobacteria bacterium]|nr:dihydroxy-acid dehydratase [Betaproteobacteria bacterium]
DDFDRLSSAVPLLARVYPNGSADVNHFHAAGGCGFVIRELLNAGLLHGDARVVGGGTLATQVMEPFLDEGAVRWRDAPGESQDANVVRPAANPFSADGGLRVLQGNLGRSVIKVSAVKAENRVVEAPARVFNDQDEVLAAFKRGELERDVVAVVKFQGPRANGMPELHKLTPALGVLQDKGFKVALVTDGRMSGASGKVPAAIHVSPECLAGGPLARVRDGDVICLDANAGTLEARVGAAEWNARGVEAPSLQRNRFGIGRELFDAARAHATAAEAGAMTFGDALANLEPQVKVAA